MSKTHATVARIGSRGLRRAPPTRPTARRRGRARARPERRPAARRTATSRSSSRSSKPACRPSSTRGRRPAARPSRRATSISTVELARLGGDVDRIEFTPQGDFLRGNRDVHEPHSFDVTVVARHAGREHRFAYESYEGRTTIAADVARAAGIGTAVAGPGTISDELVLYGAIAADATRVRTVHARFPGVIRSVSRNVGDTRARRRRARDDRVEREPADLRGDRADRRHHHGAPRRARRADGRRRRCSRSRTSRRSGPSSTCSRATGRGSRRGFPSPSRPTPARARRARSTIWRRSATARRRA